MIFDPIKINKTEIRNRMVVSAMVSNYCDTDGMATEKFIAYHEHKAAGGFGLIVTEDYAVVPEGRSYTHLAGLWKDEQIESHRKLTERVHAHGAKIFAQIFHAGRETTSDVSGAEVVAPSAVREPTMPEAPRALTVDEIHELVSRFGDTARRAKLAGFDGVEIHGAHGYMVNAFLSPFSNKRCDEYGGTIENRCRFMVEIIRDIREKCGEDFAIQLRLSTVEYVDGGLGIEDSKVIARIAEAAGIDSIHCSQGIYASLHAILPPSCVDHGAYINNAAEIKKVVNIPVIGVGRINDPLIAESILLSGKADLCTMARASLADPDMPNKYKEGRSDEIIHCVGCLQGCIGENNRGNSVRCLVNPMTGMEYKFRLEKVSEPKQVVVVGGGVAGCEAAIVAAERGYKVTLIERSGELGGQFIAASVPPGKGEFTSFIVWQKTMLRKFNVEVLYNTEATRELIDSYKPYAVIVATGGIPAMPPIPGLAENSSVAHDYLLGKKDFGGKVVVIGGGLVGAETADHMACHGATDVTVLELLPEIMMDGEPVPTYYVKKRFEEYGVRVITSARVTAVEARAVVYEKDGQYCRIDDVDYVVNATGVKSDTGVATALQSADYKVVVVGDAESAKNAFKNIQQAYEIALYI